jgi:hypothetical protein
MRAASEWIFGLRRFLLVIGLAPLGCVVLLANLGMLPERGLAWGLACAWPLLMVALVLHYRTLMVLNDILVTALLLMSSSLPHPGSKRALPGRLCPATSGPSSALP